MLQLVIRFLVGGAIVSFFASLGDMLHPKGFAGLFAAAPSVALATLALTVVVNGPTYAAVEARSMIAGEAAFIAYAAACVYCLGVRRMRAAPMITALAGWLATAFGPAFGGLFLAFPAIFPASATLLEKHEREKKQRAGIAFTVCGRLAAAPDARGALIGALGGMVFGAILWRLLPHGHPVGALSVALVGWFVASSVLWYVHKHHPWARPNRPVDAT